MESDMEINMQTKTSNDKHANGSINEPGHVNGHVKQKRTSKRQRKRKRQRQRKRKRARERQQDETVNRNDHVAVNRNEQAEELVNEHGMET